MNQIGIIRRRKFARRHVIMQKYVIERDFNVITLKYMGCKVNVDKTKYLVTSGHCIRWIIKTVINKNKFEAVDKYLSVVSTSETYQTYSYFMHTNLFMFIFLTILFKLVTFKKYDFVTELWRVHYRVIQFYLCVCALTSHFMRILRQWKEVTFSWRNNVTIRLFVCVRERILTCVWKLLSVQFLSAR